MQLCLFNTERKGEMPLILYVVRCIRLGSCGYLFTNNDYPSFMLTKLILITDFHGALQY